MIHLLKRWHPNLWTRWNGALGNCNQRAAARFWRKERFPVGFLLNVSIFILFWLSCVHHHGPLHTSGWHLRSHTQHIAALARSFTSSKVSASALWLCWFILVLRQSWGTAGSVAEEGGMRKSITVMKCHSHSSSPARYLCHCRSWKINLAWILEHKIWPLRKSVILLVTVDWSSSAPAKRYILHLTLILILMHTCSVFCCFFSSFFFFRLVKS